MQADFFGWQILINQKTEGKKKISDQEYEW